MQIISFTFLNFLSLSLSLLLLLHRLLYSISVQFFITISVVCILKACNREPFFHSPCSFCMCANAPLQLNRKHNVVNAIFSMLFSLLFERKRFLCLLFYYLYLYWARVCENTTNAYNIIIITTIIRVFVRVRVHTILRDCCFDCMWKPVCSDVYCSVLHIELTSVSARE